MENLFILWICLILLIIAIWVRKFIRYNSRLPPGPIGLPLVGYLPFILKGKPHVIFSRMAEKYGDIFSMYLGRRLIVVLNSYDIIKEAFVEQSDIFVGRPGTDYLKKKELPGVFQSEGALLKDYKRHSMGILRDYGFGKSSLEPVIAKEVNYLNNTITELHEKPTDISNLLRFSFANVILTVLINKRFDYRNETLQKLVANLTEFLRRSQMVNLEFFLPKFLLNIPKFASWVGYESATEYGDHLLVELKSIITEIIEKEEAENADNFIFSWLKANKKTPHENSHKSIDKLTQVVRSLFNAGTDTIALTMQWLLMYLMENPSIQKRIQNEIDDVIGDDRQPVYEDQAKMPFTDATIMETHRISTILPIANRCNIVETKLKSYVIPKRSIIMPNLWAIHRSAETYQDASTFRPERFLDSEGNIKIPEKYVPFSLGKRQCIGANYSKIELFIYVTSLLQKFTFVKPENDKLCFDYDRCIVSIPKPFRVVALIRKKKTTL